jgi:potassium efflux system protein
MREAIVLRGSTWAVLVLAVCLRPFSAPAAEAPVTPAASTTPAGAAAAPAATTLYDIVSALAQVDRLEREAAATLRSTEDWTTLAAPLDTAPLAATFRTIVEASDSATRVRYLELRALDAHLRERIRTVSDATAGLGRMAQRLVTEVERLEREAKLWPQRAASARAQQAPPEVLANVDAVVPTLTAAREPLVARRDRVLIAYERGTRLQSRLESLRSDIADRRERVWTALRTFVAAPVWNAEAAGLPFEELRGDTELMRYELAEYLQRSGEPLAVLFVVLGAIMFALLRRPATPETTGTPAEIPVGMAVSGALVVTLVCVAVFAPSPVPIGFYRLVWFLFPLLAAVVATRTFARGIRPTAWALSFAVFLNEFRAVAEMSPLSDWVLLVLQVVPFGAGLVRDWRRGALSAFLPHWPQRLLQWTVRALLAVLAAAVAASMLGYVGIALALVALAVIAPGYALGFAAVVWTLDRALRALLATAVARTLRSVRERSGAILRVLHRFVVLAAWVVGGTTFALSYSALDDLVRVGTFIVNASVTVGDITITLRAILTALLVVVATWLLTSLVRFVLDHELLPRLPLRTGVPIAISTIVGYVLVVTGFVLATAALGIDLTKVTLLAGAVGVGVGFGLQNVVNNFASGLILMVERPINVGDQIDVGGVIGEVKRIGVRSSTIRTFQGAEVIVPNADLAQKQVTNWTLSDRARRYEIDLGVAYGSDPAQVLRLLEAAAASVPEVQKKPPPRALFTGFGDSSLDFRLLAWVESMDVGLQAQNGLRMAILRALDEARIEIPFPQRDLHIRHAASAVEPAPPPRAVA